MSILLEPTQMGFGAMLLRPIRACDEILIAQDYVLAMIGVMEPGRIIHPSEHGQPPMVKLKDFWIRPFKILRLFIKVWRLGIVKAVEIELEKMKIVSISKLGEELTMERAIQVATERRENRHSEYHPGN